MIKINLLPWRQSARRKRKILQLSLLFFIAILAALFFWLFKYSIHPHVKKIPQKIIPMEINQPLRWSGYILYENQFLGLVSFTNGKTIVVQKDSLINHAIRVIFLKENGMMILRNNKKEWIGDAF